MNEKLDKIYEEADRDGKLVAVVKYPYEKPETVAITKGLETLQGIVGGYITAADLPDMDDVYGFCNDEGLLIGLEPNFYRPVWKDGIVGPAVFLGAGDEGESVSLSREQVKKVTDYLNAHSVRNKSEFYVNIKTDFLYYKPKTVAEM